MKGALTSFRTITVTTMTAVALLANASMAFALTGAIFTTDSSCSGTNVNHFALKSEVYLDGGPHHIGSAGLTDGNYYVKVTTPNGVVLGKTTTASAVVSGGSFALCYQLSSILKTTSSSFTVAGYDTTTNMGGVYKVWVSPDASFPGGNTKTDNFKVQSNVTPPPPSTGSISGVKWEDMNANGVKDAGDDGLSGWAIDLYNSSHTTLLTSTVTNATGAYSFTGIPAGTYQVCEEMQLGWYPSFPTTTDPNCHTAVVVAANTDTANKSFGNYEQVSLTVIKHVVNDNGGTKLAGDFTMNVTGTSVSTTSFAGIEAGREVTLKPGSYSVGENATFGYTQTIPDADCSGTATSGQSVACTITNDDIQPKLTVIKHVINDNTGTKIAANFTMLVTGTSPSQTSFAGSETGVDVMLNAGTYTADELADSGYEKTLSANCSGMISVGEVKVCTITNNDKPPTRTQGFWGTHTAFSSSNWSPVTLCGTKTIDAVQTTAANKLMGGFWSNIAKKSTGQNRAGVDKSRMVLLQQVLAAILNQTVLGANDGGAIATAKTAYCGTNTAAMGTSTAALDTFNNSGDSAPLPSLLNPGSATPGNSTNQANMLFWNTTI